MNIENPESVTEAPTNEPSIHQRLRDAALKVQAMEIRERMVASILDTLELNALDGRDTGESELDSDAIVVARYVTTLADALGQYVVTGEVTKYPAENDGE